MHTITARPGDYIVIGREGEHKARRVRFDLTHWVDLYGDGTAQLVYQRPGDTVPYPVTLEREGGWALWVVTSTDTAQAGRDGRAELRYYVGDVLAKSEIYFISVGRALTAPGEVPEPPGKSWLDQALEAKQAAVDAAGRAETAIGGAAWVDFEMDAEGNLYAVTPFSSGADFALDENGILEVVLNV